MRSPGAGALPDLFAQYKCDPVLGLHQQEAHHRLKKYGLNQLHSGKKTSLFSLFLEQFSDFMVLVLMVAALISFVISIWFDGDIIDPIIILIIVFLNACVGVIQECRAEAALAALKKMQAPHALVIRDGKNKRIPACEVVVGDLVRLKGGDIVPADGILSEAVGFAVDESILTGESHPVEKFSGDSVYASTALLNGNGIILVTAIGMDTEVGKIADLIKENSSPQTPLQKKLSRVSLILGSGALAVCFAVFLLGLYRKMPLGEILLTAISLAVAVIPEGLPTIVTVMLALGVRRMAQKKCIVRRLPAVETLGSVQVILSDKTGTLTQNKLTVSNIYGSSSETLALALLASNRSDATEEALFKEAERTKVFPEKIFPNCIRTAELPFTSDRKRMTVTLKEGDHFRVIMKGGGDVVLPFCSNREPPAMLHEWTSLGMRVIAVASYTIPINPTDPENGPFHLIGLIALEDPVRPQSPAAISCCREAGIRTIIATGDHPSTAQSIARKIGILSEHSEVLTGKNIDQMSDDELLLSLESANIFARVTPVHKLRLTKLLQAKGLTVAMTGDGVNDAPALKAADIGLAMGRNGSEVARQASDMILTDSDFSCIVDAVEEGRTVYRNVRKALHFLLSCNIGEILVVLGTLLLGCKTLLSPIQLLWINLVTDSFPALALGFEKAEADCMKSGPIQSNSLFSDSLGFKIIMEGFVIGSLSLSAFYIGALYLGGSEIGTTLCFGTLSFSQLTHVFNVRSELSFFRSSPFSNRHLSLAILFSFSLQGIVMFLPFLRPLFQCVPLTGSAITVLFVLSLLPIFFSELIKLLCRPKQASRQ